MIYTGKADTSNAIGGERRSNSYSGWVWREFQGVISAGVQLKGDFGEISEL